MTSSVGPHLLQIIDAFKVPQPMWDATRKRFYLDRSEHSLLPPALAKVQVTLARLQMVRQRLLRSETFNGRILKIPDSEGKIASAVQV